MPLPPSDAQRTLKHRRSIDIEIFGRSDGLWEVEAHLRDVKTRDSKMADGIRAAGTPIHGLLLRLVIDSRLRILQAGSESEWVPYADHCRDHGDVYAALVGLNLLQGFRRAVHERLGGVRGCTHLTELAQVLPTAVIQGLVGEVIDSRGSAKDSLQPFQLDRCHALRTDGDAVRLHYPRWYRAPAFDGTANVS